MTLTRQQALPVIRSMVVDSLCVELDEVQPESLLLQDLGADSLDLVDLLFMLDKEFGVRIREGKLSFLSGLGSDAGGDLVDGRLAKEHVAELIPWLPGLEAHDPELVTPAHVLSLITVETLWLLVEQTQG